MISFHYVKIVLAGLEIQINHLVNLENRNQNFENSTEAFSLYNSAEAFLFAIRIVCPELAKRALLCGAPAALLVNSSRATITPTAELSDDALATDCALKIVMQLVLATKQELSQRLEGAYPSKPTNWPTESTLDPTETKKKQSVGTFPFLQTSFCGGECCQIIGMSNIL